METGTKLTLGQAHKLTGVPKGTLSKALKSGKLSYLSKTSAGYQIDRSELLRVFPLKPQETALSERLETPEIPLKNGVLEVELKAERDMRERLEREIEDLRGQRDKWQGQAERLLLERPVPTPEKRAGLLGRIFRG